VPDRHGGQPFNYFRRKGHKDVPLPRGNQRTPEFLAAYRVAITGTPLPNVVRKELDRSCRAGSWNAMIAAYMATDEYRRLVKKDDRLRAFKVMREDMKLGDALVAETDFVVVGQYIDKVKQKTPGWARGLRTTLSLLCAQAILHKLLTANPIREIPRPVLANVDGIHDWTDDEIAKYEKHHKTGTMARRALDIGVETGLRLSDLHRVGDEHVDGDGLISLIPWKTRRLGERARVFIPVTDKLTASAAAMTVVVPINGKRQDHRRWLSTVTGKPFSADYLGECFAKWIDEAGLPAHCTAHGLRKSFVRRMINAGHSVTDVAAMTGHQDLALVMFYARQRDQRLAGLRVKAAGKKAA